MCMCMAFEEDQPVFHVRTSSSQPPKLHQVVARVHWEKEHMKALAKYLLSRVRERSKIIQFPDEYKQAS